MFAFLRGIIARKDAHRVELDVNGVGYDVLVPERIAHKLTPSSPATLLTYCYIREDIFQIYGFLREEERALFKTLLGVTGVGPKAALAVLSAMSIQEIGRAILENDVKAFTRISGIGTKGAQRIILEMKAKLGQDTELSVLLGEAPEPTADTDDVIAALCALGCTLPEARKAAAKARQGLPPDARDEEVVKAALRSLAKT